MFCSSRCIKAELVAFFFIFSAKGLYFWSVKDEGRRGHRYILLSLMTPIPFHGLLSRLNHTHSLEGRLCLCAASPPRPLRLSHARSYAPVHQRVLLTPVDVV